MCKTCIGSIPVITLVEYQVGDPPEVFGSSILVLFSFLQEWRVKRKITFVLFFEKALRQMERKHTVSDSVEEWYSSFIGLQH